MGKRLMRSLTIGALLGTLLVGVCVVTPTDAQAKDGAVTLGKLTSAAPKKMKVTWKKRSGAGGYQVQVALNKAFTSGKKSATVAGGKKTSKELSGLKSGRYYYVKVRSYTVSSGKKTYGAWSTVKTKRVKAKYDRAQFGSGLSKKQQNQVIAQCEKAIKASVKPGMSETEIADAVLNYEARRVDSNYTLVGKTYKHKENTAWGALVRRHAACSGHVRALRALCDGAGLPSKHVNASKWEHQWAKIKASGKWYTVDPQMGSNYHYFYTVAFPTREEIDYKTLDGASKTAYSLNTSSQWKDLKVYITSYEFNWSGYNKLYPALYEKYHAQVEERFGFDDEACYRGLFIKDAKSHNVSVWKATSTRVY